MRCSFFLKKEKEVKSDIVRLSVVALPFSYLMAKVAGLIFYNPRPFVSDNIVPLIYHTADNGFPSDHTLLCATVSSVIYFFDKKWGGILLTISLLVGVSRVYAGVHHFTDIFGSVIIAGVSVFLVRKIMSKYFRFI